MRQMRWRCVRRMLGVVCLLVITFLGTGWAQVLPASAAPQDTAPHEIGVVYYADGPNFKTLQKEAAPASGRVHFSAKMKGAHAAVRIASGKTAELPRL
ncbi:MAG TPA: hypothetical protein VK699_05945 [Terriglobales bacterium]|jgi:hypothetical protein|nr:hypothetical protein [Terriglobales bacterium]